METKSFNIPISLIRQHCFCRRIPYFVLALGVNPPKSGWVTKGKEQHQEIERLLKRRKLQWASPEDNFLIKYEVPLYSQKIRMHGICDGYIYSNNNISIVPFEIKSNESPRINQGEILQLCAYAMLLEERYNILIKKGFLLYGSRTSHKEVLFTPDLRKKTLSIRNTIEDDINQGLIPITDANNSKCSQCEFMNFCADRF